MIRSGFGGKQNMEKSRAERKQEEYRQVQVSGFVEYLAEIKTTT